MQHGIHRRKQKLPFQGVSGFMADLPASAYTFFRYSVSSLLSALLDEGLFVLLSGLLIGVVSGFS